MVGDDGRLGVDPATGLEITGFTENAWIGLSLLHGIFAMEHNAICAMLKRHNPSWDDERLFQQARLVNSALLAKIHTVEWTPAILPNPVTAAALRTNWRGLLGDLQKVLTHLNDNELLGGIPGSPTDHHTAPYSLTEEFVSVYRMHELIPDDYTIRSVSTGQVLGQFTLPTVLGSPRPQGRRAIRLRGPVLFAGDCSPRRDTAAQLPDAPAEPDTTQRGTVRSGDHRHPARPRARRAPVQPVPPPASTRIRSPRSTRSRTTRQWADEIRRVYNNDLEKVDLHVGLVSEPLPPGFGFSDTAFRVFILMASRRLKSDRFLSKDYRQEIYTKQGIDWVENTSMIDILARHFPKLAPRMKDIESAFHPWRRIS